MTLAFNEFGGQSIYLAPQAVIRAAPGGEWLHFQNPEAVIETSRIEDVIPKLDEVEGLVAARRWWAVGFLSFEAAPAFDAAFEVLPSDGFPLLWFGLYKKPVVHKDCPSLEKSSHRLEGWSPSVSRAAYDQALSQIKNHLANGETYQVNYTFRLRSSFSGSSWAFFEELARAQNGAYAAYLDTGRFAICSVSPELFFHLDGRRLITRPMKGTAARGRFWAEDVEKAKALRHSEKERAENAMIVDMLRNDVGRIANPGSVRVVRPFAVECYPTLWQMTTTVEAETKAGVGEILTALFPCGSVTGAPKVNTMKIIASLESEPRKIYTGAIGFIAPGRRAQFNVAIRTVLIDRQERRAEYGVGSGIVWDSVDHSEYEECLLKTRVLTFQRPDFSLLESILWQPERGYFLLARHLRRLRNSAAYFRFPIKMSRVEKELSKLAASLSPQLYKVRLLLASDGTISCEAISLPANPSSAPSRLKLAPFPVNSANPFLYHKTTHRPIHDAARRECADCDDVLLWNERGEVTEASVSNVIVELRDGGRVTPPVSSGLLPGVFREKLLARREVQEQTVTVNMLKNSRRIYLVNSVRGWQDAVILPETVTPPPAPEFQAADTNFSRRG